jgi:hypothetical protein
MPIDAYYFYQKSDPDRNQHFRRAWSEREFSAAELDRLSDHELSVGYLARSGELKALAATMRTEAGR